MRRRLSGGYELDDDRDRLDLDTVDGYLGGEPSNRIMERPPPRDRD